MSDLRWTDDAIARMELGEADADYLRSVGLPAEAIGTLEVMPVPAASDGRVVIAHDGPVAIYVGAAGAVVADEGARQRLVSSNVRCFGAVLALYQEYRARVRKLDEDGAIALVDEIAERMRAADPAAMADADAYWPIVVEQMRDGLL